MLSIIADSTLRYPAAGNAFSPDVAYPEYPFGRVAGEANRIYDAVRTVLAQGGLDAERYGRPQWNPLGAFIRPGDRVFVLCNFVYHRKPHESVEAFASKCTHGSVLRALLDYAIIAAGPGGRVEFGNAPVQSGDWSRVLADTGAAEVAAFHAGAAAARDLRMYVAPRTFGGAVEAVDDRTDNEQLVRVDLGADSLLADHEDPSRYRVADYDPRATASYHAGGRHVYAIHRRVLEADVVISLPKLKTHEKVGITCGIKGFVGAIALKDCLAHHRAGGQPSGGDEYPRARSPVRLASAFHDWVQRRPPGAAAQALRMVDTNLRRVLRRTGAIQGGAWYGNDTAWRMAHDIGRILRYCSAAGEMGDLPRRRHVMLLDGVVGGEGEGPLAPSPVHSGVLLFSDDVAVGDLAAALLMGFEPDRLPIVREAFAQRRYPLTDARPADTAATANGRTAGLAELPALCRPFRPPRGWRGRVEAQ
jgi:uncharacterized protein (DUF362 family)